ncbi:hypothetical protein K493DRAFT_103557 [Basidiobolus meristosporus CBS 931.73]|uniref:Uncharacterized protein n=1 Tax=Basidiobolus meristosporus CBS 931.73 TaxID=1314790 RepID=A0A1Y1YQV9_9FUNG|nr:hypothetical protein K493DRAFT_103557 [Basidiobolus meristosporus CBS 931.73]|eukprot:ORY00410.1 hypothetical protein K493DRAFT_103557 [Basidiobolus meristosporus CBS 931.73]
MAKTNEEFHIAAQQGSSKVEERFQKMKDKLVKAMDLATDTQLKLQEKSADWNDERRQFEMQIKSLEKTIQEKSAGQTTLAKQKRANNRGAAKAVDDDIIEAPESGGSSDEKITNAVRPKQTRKQVRASVIPKNIVVEDSSESEPEEQPPKKGNKRVTKNSGASAKMKDSPELSKSTKKEVAKSSPAASLPSPKQTKKKANKANIELPVVVDIPEVDMDEPETLPEELPPLSDAEDKPVKKTISIKKPLIRKKKPAAEEPSLEQITELVSSETSQPPQLNLKKKISFNRKRQTLPTESSASATRNTSRSRLQKKEKDRTWQEQTIHRIERVYGKRLGITSSAIER